MAAAIASLAAAGPGWSRPEGERRPGFAAGAAGW